MLLFVVASKLHQIDHVLARFVSEKLFDGDIDITRGVAEE